MTAIWRAPQTDSFIWRFFINRNLFFCNFFRMSTIPPRFSAMNNCKIWSNTLASLRIGTPIHRATSIPNLTTAMLTPFEYALPHLLLSTILPRSHLFSPSFPMAPDLVCISPFPVGPSHSLASGLLIHFWYKNFSLLFAMALLPILHLITRLEIGA